MKVPIRYKSSDRYNAGVDVVYDDESKLQYAPFIYATTASGDNGGDGEDEEGEDSMVVHLTGAVDAMTADKTWLDISNAIVNDKAVYFSHSADAGYNLYYLSNFGNGEGIYWVDAFTVDSEGTLSRISLFATSEDGLLSMGGHA